MISPMIPPKPCARSVRCGPTSCLPGLRLAVLLCVLSAVLLAGPAALPAFAQGAAPKLVGVEVAGAQTVRDEQVRAWAELEAGQPVSREAVARAIRSLYDTGRFREVFIYEIEKAGGIELAINVIEYPRLSVMQIKGADKIDEDELEEATEITPGAFLSPARLRKAREAITERYRADGYYNAEVQTNDGILQLTGSQPLVIQVIENEKVRVRNFEFVGNDHLFEAQLRQGFKTKTDGWITSGTFKAPEFEADLDQLVTNYANAGFLEARVVEHELVQLENDENHVTVRIVLEEGPRYRVGSLSYSGNEVFETEHLRTLVTLVPGRVFDQSRMIESRQNLSAVYWDEGYIYVNIEPVQTIRDDNVIDLEFAVREGEPARIRQVLVTGNSKTHERVIRRELRIQPGDLFSNNSLRNSQGDLFRLGFFGDVRVDFRESENADKIDLVFDVEEKQTGQFTMGVGFSQQTRASGFFNIGEANLFGRGQSLNFAWQFGRRRNFLDISFTEPWFMGTPTLIGFDVYSRFSNTVQDFYDTRTTGFAVRLGRPIPGARFTRGTLRYKYNRTTLTNFDPSYVAALDRLEREFGDLNRLDETDWPQVETGVTLTLSRNSSDNPFFPSRGSRASLRTEVNGGIFGGDLDILRVDVDYDWYQAMPMNLVFHVGTSAAHITGYRNTDRIPDYLRFRLGGNRFYKLRGYTDLSVVPRGNPGFVGGRFYSTFTAELAYKISNAIQVLAFVDQGDTWNDFKSADLTKLRTGAGFGVRLEVPLVGRVGLDYGYGFDKRDLGQQPGWELHFNFGNFF
ncbi:outer membrane protein assembly factor BamA [bacterium]|nr:MAG: outer membrane protein assembly factor BamA [bacterium]